MSAAVGREVVADAVARAVARAAGVAWLWSGDGVIEIAPLRLDLVLDDVNLHRLPAADGQAP